MTNINSTDDARVDNNPPQRPVLPGDPMRVQYRVLTDDEKRLMGEKPRAGKVSLFASGKKVGRYSCSSRTA